MALEVGTILTIKKATTKTKAKASALAALSAASKSVGALLASATFKPSRGFDNYILDAKKEVKAYIKLVKKAGHSTATDAALLEIADTFAKAVVADYIAQYDGFAPSAKKQDFVDCVGAEESDTYMDLLSFVYPEFAASGSSKETPQYKLLRKRMLATAVALLTSHVDNKAEAMKKELQKLEDKLHGTGKRSDRDVDDLEEEMSALASKIKKLDPTFKYKMS